MRLLPTPVSKLNDAGHFGHLHPIRQLVAFDSGRQFADRARDAGSNVCLFRPGKLIERSPLMIALI